MLVELKGEAETLYCCIYTYCCGIISLATTEHKVVWKKTIEERTREWVRDEKKRRTSYLLMTVPIWTSNTKAQSSSQTDRKTNNLIRSTEVLLRIMYCALRQNLFFLFLNDGTLESTLRWQARQCLNRTVDKNRCQRFRVMQSGEIMKHLPRNPIIFSRAHHHTQSTPFWTHRKNKYNNML